MREFRRERHEEDRLSAFLDDELADRDALVVTRHLADCDQCMTELEDIRAARTFLRGLPYVEPPVGLLHDVSLLAVDAREHWPRSTRVAVAAILGSAVFAAAAFAAGADQDGTISPPIDLFVVDHVGRVGGGPMLTPVDLGVPGG